MSTAQLPRPVPGFYTPTKFYPSGEAPNAPRKRARRDHGLIYGPPIPFNLDAADENEQPSASQSETMDE